MARLPRLVVAGEPHLVLQRGHDRQPVFAAADDAAAYLQALDGAARATGVHVHAYGLLASEVRLLVTPPDAAGLARLMQSTAGGYTRWFLQRHGRTGTPWEGRFRSAPVDAAAHFIECLALVEAPRGSPDDEPAQVLLTSLPHHEGVRRDALIAEHAAFWILGNTPFEREAAYRRYVKKGLGAGIETRLVAAAEKGWAIGDPAYAERLAKVTGRRATPRPRGRPRVVQS